MSLADELNSLRNDWGGVHVDRDRPGYLIADKDPSAGILVGHRAALFADIINAALRTERKEPACSAALIDRALAAGAHPLDLTLNAALADALASRNAEIASLKQVIGEAVEVIENLAEQAELAMRREGGEGAWAVDAARSWLTKHRNTEEGGNDGLATQLQAFSILRLTTPVSEEVVERVARIIDPPSWAVMDGYLEQTKRKYRGQHVGWPSDQFHHKESMTKAREIIASLLPPTTAAPAIDRDSVLEEAAKLAERGALAATITGIGADNEAAGDGIATVLKALATDIRALKHDNGGQP